MKSVLIIDDAAFMRLSLKTLLQDGGFEVVGEAEDGVSGIDMYKQLKPDIVTMDITMPKMDGIEALKGILEVNPKAKVIMVSALGQESYVKKALLSGARTFIVKPFKNDYVLQTISKIAAL